MGETTNISWCDRTWSPWFGCTQVSMGPQGACEGCYARHMHETRFKRVVFGGPGRGEGTRSIRAESAWQEPLRWDREAAASGKPCFVFPSMCDPFDNHPDLVEARRRFFALIRATPRLTWLLLTKRPGNIVKLFRETLPDPAMIEVAAWWPRNAAALCTVVNQPEADRDVPKLLEAAAILRPAFTGVSMEPLLGPADLTRVCLQPRRPGSIRAGIHLDALRGRYVESGQPYRGDWDVNGPAPTSPGVALDWIITGGETDQGKHKARPSNPQWFRDIGAQCAAAGVPWHHKQNGEWVSVSEAEGAGEHFTFADGRTVRRIGKGRDPCTLDGVRHDARPRVAVAA